MNISKANAITKANAAGLEVTKIVVDANGVKTFMVGNVVLVSTEPGLWKFAGRENSWTWKIGAAIGAAIINQR